MLKPGNIERRVIAAVAFLMIASGVGAFVSISLREAARAGFMSYPVGYVCGIHAFTIIIPGFVGLFVVFGCGCCNTRPAYITSLVFDIVGLVFYVISIIILAIVFELVSRGPSSPTQCTLVQGECKCSRNDYDDWYFYSSFDNGCDRNNMFHASRIALFCMWVFGLLFTIIHLVLVARLSCVMRSGTPGQVLNAPGQSGVLLQTLVVQDSAQVFAAPTSAYVSQPQTTSMDGAAPVGAPWTGACTGQPPPYSLQAPAQVGDAQASPLTAQPQPSSKSAAPPV